MAVVWNLYFMVAVGRKLLWILFREIRHAALKLQSVLRRASPGHCRCQNSQQCSEPKALLRKAKESSIRSIRLFSKTAECPHLEYFIQNWSLPLSAPYTGLRTAELLGAALCMLTEEAYGGS